MGISTWYWSKGDQGRIVYKQEKFEVWFLNIELNSYHIYFTDGVSGLRLEYALDGSSNYISWKDRLEPGLEANCLRDFIDQEVQKLIDATRLVEWKKCVARARRILLEGV